MRVVIGIRISVRQKNGVFIKINMIKYIFFCNNKGEKGNMLVNQ